MTADLLSRLPLPLAQVYLRARNAKAPAERHQHGYYLLEATVKFLGAVAAQGYLAEGERDGAVDEALSTFSSPSLGHWVQALRALSGHYHSKQETRAHPFADWSKKLAKRTRDLPRCTEFTIKLARADGLKVRLSDSLSPLDIFNMLPYYRNKHMGHGAAALESFYGEFGTLLVKMGEEILTLLDPLPAGADLVLADEKRELGDGHAAVERLRLVGGLPFRCDTIEVPPEKADSWHTGRLYLAWKGGRKPVCLYPLLHGTWADEVAEVHFFNGLIQGAAPEFLSYLSGKTLRAEKLAADGASLFARVAAQPSREVAPPPEPHPMRADDEDGCGIGAGEGAELGGSPGRVRALTESLDRLEIDTDRLADACRQGPADLDSVLQAVTRFQSGAHSLSEELRAAVECWEDPAILQALLLSLSHLAVQAEHLVQGAASSPEAQASLAGFLAWIQKSLHTPATRLCQEMDRRLARGEAESEFFSIHEERPEFVLPEAGDWVDDLMSPDDLRRHEAMLTLSDGGMETFLRHLHTSRPSERDRLLEAVWGHADLLLGEARGRSRAVFEAAQDCAESPPLREKWEYLHFLFRKVGGEYWDPDIVRISLEDKFSADRRTFGRCFLLHPWDPYRKLALEILDPQDYWEVITSPDTPVRWLLELWTHLKPKVPLDFLKVFLVCARDSLIRPGGPERVMASVELVKEFYRVDVFHEDLYFKILMEIDEAVRAEGRRHRLLVDLDRDYAESFKEFRSRRAYQDQPVSNWSLVPLPIQRRLANRGYFLKYFACHPNDRIAMECLRHLLIMESVIEYLAVPAINGRLLVEMSKEKRLFYREEARYALVANPKSPSYVILRHISFLRKDNLRRLSEDREGNLFSRQFAEKLLQRGDGKAN